MSYNGEGPKLELKLRLSPPRDQGQILPAISPRRSHEERPDGARCYSGSMMLVGCPRCLMYVMLFEDEPKCPKCKSTVLLDFLHHRTK